MVGDSLGLVLVIPVNKDARRAGEIDQIAFEIDLFHSGLRGFFLFGKDSEERLPEGVIKARPRISYVMLESMLRLVG